MSHSKNQFKSQSKKLKSLIWFIKIKDIHKNESNQLYQVCSNHFELILFNRQFEPIHTNDSSWFDSFLCISDHFNESIQRFFLNWLLNWLFNKFVQIICVDGFKLSRTLFIELDRNSQESTKLTHFNKLVWFICVDGFKLPISKNQFEIRSQKSQNWFIEMDEHTQVVCLIHLCL